MWRAPRPAAARYRRYLVFTARSMMGIAALLNLMLLGLSALMWSDTRSTPATWAVTGVPLVAVLAVVACLTLRVGAVNVAASACGRGGHRAGPA